MLTSCPNHPHPSFRKGKHATPRCRRRGAVLTAELVIITPVLVGVALVILQFMLVASAKFRVEAAAVEGARLAALGQTPGDIHVGVGLVLAPHLSGAYETVLQYRDRNDDSVINQDDSVIVQVRIPQSIVGHDWLGFFGGTVKDLHLRSVVERRLEDGVEITPPS